MGGASENDLDNAYIKFDINKNGQLDQNELSQFATSIENKKSVNAGGISA